MKALVTGASGFIGSTLIEMLGNDGAEVFALMRKTSSAANLQGMKFTRLEGDLSNEESLRKAVKEVDTIFHLAGVVAAPTRDAYFKNNSEGTARVARAVADSNPGIKRFVYVSSIAASGPATRLEPKKESDADLPVSAYGESKLQGEKEVLKFKDVFPVSIVRPPMVYGPKDTGVFVAIRTVSRRLMPILQGKTPDRKKYYSLVHAEDLCRGIIAAANPKIPSGEIFYVTGDGVYSYEQMLKVIADALEVKALRLPLPTWILTGTAHALDHLGRISGKNFPLNKDKLNEILPDYWIFSNEKAKRMLDFTPRYDLPTGMKNAVDWYRKNKWI